MGTIPNTHLAPPGRASAASQGDAAATRVLSFPSAPGCHARPAADASAPDRPAPYTVRRYSALAGQALLVGFDGAGAPLMELRVASALCTADLVEWVREWCREHGARPLRLEERQTETRPDGAQ